MKERWYHGQIGRLVGASLCAVLAFGCGSDDGGQNGDQQALNEVLENFGHATAVRLDAAPLAAAVRAGEAITLPFGLAGGTVGEREVELTLRNLRNPNLTEAVLKDGVAGSFARIALPLPSTYQGTVRDGGAAVFTITDDLVEGSMLVSPEGWAFIEPLEPQLRLHDVAPPVRERLLRKYNHIVYNAADAIGSSAGGDPDSQGVPTELDDPPPPQPLVMTLVADGDTELLRAYPLDSAMPFWLKQESILNAIDWLYNCLEPEANADNAYTNCANDFDGGSNAFQARVRIDGFEAWSAGGPDARLIRGLVNQSVEMTHQASPPCCGPPHTAGQANVVYFFSGKHLPNGGGEAFGVGGLNYYGELCSDTTTARKCHHAGSQIIPSPTFRGTTFHQWMFVAHEIGHVNNGPEAFFVSPVSWLFDEQHGVSIMDSQRLFTADSLFLYNDNEARRFIAPLLAEQLEPASAE